MKLDPKIGRSLKKASPTILTCIGVAGVVATAVLAVKATPKADSLIKADSRRNHDGDPYAATKLEAVKSCWKCLNILIIRIAREKTQVLPPNGWRKSSTAQQRPESRARSRNLPAYSCPMKLAMLKPLSSRMSLSLV